MLKEQRQVYYDPDLKIEAYHLEGVIQKFPNHFHDYYVIGFIEAGKRHLYCKGEEYDLLPGDMILFNPGDNHCCAPVDGESLDYRAVNVGTEAFAKAVNDVTGGQKEIRFHTNVVRQSELSVALREVYQSILEKAPAIEKEELWFFFMEQILKEYGTTEGEIKASQEQTAFEQVCRYLEIHYMENITLEELTAIAGYGKSHFMHSFTRIYGVSPYRYLQTVRISEAKRMLEQHLSISDVAMQTGFADQSHFTRLFKEFIGLTPKQYQNIFERQN